MQAIHVQGSVWLNQVSAVQGGRKIWSVNLETKQVVHLLLGWSVIEIFPFSCFISFPITLAIGASHWFIPQISAITLPATWRTLIGLRSQNLRYNHCPQVVQLLRGNKAREWMFLDSTAIALVEICTGSSIKSLDKKWGHFSLPQANHIFIVLCFFPHIFMVKRRRS